MSISKELMTSIMFLSTHYAARSRVESAGDGTPMKPAIAIRALACVSVAAQLRQEVVHGIVMGCGVVITTRAHLWDAF